MYIGPSKERAVESKKIDPIGEVAEPIDQMEAEGEHAQVLGLTAAVNKGLVNAAKPTIEITENPLPAVLQEQDEALEKLDYVEIACLESMRQDFDRGIVKIDANVDKGTYQAANVDKGTYQAALEEDKTAGQSWEAVQERLLANEAALLKKAVALSKLTGGGGACLVGVYENGELAIRQRSQEIVSVKWIGKGKLKLLFHPEAKAQKSGRWAIAVEILRAVKAAGYHVPADAPYHNKKGLVAAFEAVTGADYVASPNRNELREAMLECPDNVPNGDSVRLVRFYPRYEKDGVSHDGYTKIGSDFALIQESSRGAVLWIRG